MSALLNRDFLVRNLCFFYRLIVASAPLLEFAIPRADGALSEYYEKHLDEERGHDAMLLADLKAMGIDDVPYDFTAAQLAGSQYYLIAHFHPALLLGYMGVLESQPLRITQIEDIEKAHACTLSAVRLHAEHDPHHITDLMKMRAALSPDLQQAIDWNAQGVRDVLNAEYARWANAQSNN